MLVTIIVQINLCQKLSNPHYDIRCHWITSSVHENSKLRTWGEHEENMLCTKIVFFVLFWHSEQFMHTTCSELVVFMYWTGESMNNLLSCCGLVDVRIRASKKDIPVFLSGFNNALLVTCHVKNRSNQYVSITIGHSFLIK